MIYVIGHLSKEPTSVIWPYMSIMHGKNIGPGHLIVNLIILLKLNFLKKKKKKGKTLLTF